MGTRSLSSVLLLAAFCLFGPVSTPAQQGTIASPESLTVDGVPPIPASLAEIAGRYSAYRNATLADWHPTRHEMLVSTRFGDIGRPFR